MYNENNIKLESSRLLEIIFYLYRILSLDSTNCSKIYFIESYKDRNAVPLMPLTKK